MRLIDFHQISPFYTEDPDEPFAVHVIVETPRGSGHKYRYNEQYGVLELSRILRGGMVWPCDFGFIPQTLGGDGDPLDVALLIEEPSFPGCLLRVRLLGVIGLVKNGEENDRLVACPIAAEAPGWESVQTMEDISQRQLRELEAFLTDYNTFEGNQIMLTGWRPREAALEAVHAATRAWHRALPAGA
jgi:inorganic pyrophosphatase